MGFRYDIQGLRALAVLLVYLFHLNSSWLSGGFVGVDIFFVISGFLVSSIILHKKEKGTFGFVDFYIGRIKRIVPVFLLLLIFVGIVGSLVYLSGDIQGLRKNIFHSAIFNSNNYLASLDDYFGASSQENPLLHTWTLSIEMQFYFLLPLFLILVNRKYIVTVSLVIIGLFFGYSFYNSTFLNNQSAMYFSLIARIPEFLIGTVFALKANSIKIFLGKQEDVVAAISLIGIIFCGVFYTEFINFPGLWVILPCMFAGLLLITTESIVNRLFSNKFFVHIGELSYSIYLWHWAIMALWRYYYVRIDFIWYEMLLITLLTYLFSWLSYTYVENVFRTYLNKKFIIQFGVIVASLGGVVFAMPKLNSSTSSIPDIYSKPIYGLDSHGKTFARVGVLGDSLKTNDSILLIGDSHALVYKKVLDISGKENNFNVKTITNDLYPTIPSLDEKDFKALKYYNQYQRLIKESRELIKESKIIIVSSIWSKSIPSLERSFEELVQSLNSNQHIVIISDFPVLEKNPLRLSRSIVVKDNEFHVRKTSSELPDYITKILNENKNVHYLDLDYSEFKQIPLINDTLAYYDDGHLNYYGASKVGKYFSKNIYEFINEIRYE